MDTGPTIGRVVVAAGMITTMTRTTTLTAPGGGVPAPPGSGQEAVAAPATLTARLQVDLGAQAIPLGPDPGPHPHATAVARASAAPRMSRRSLQKPTQRHQVRQQTAVLLRKHLEVNGLTTTQAPSRPVLRLVLLLEPKRKPPLALKAKGPGVVVLCGEPLAAPLPLPPPLLLLLPLPLPLQPRVLPSQCQQPPSAALASFQRKIPKLEIRLEYPLPSKSMFFSLYLIVIPVSICFFSLAFSRLWLYNML